MFDELKKYRQNNHFFFKPADALSKVCNAPIDKSGVYLIYKLSKGRVELIYIGSSGKMQPDGNIKHRKGGIFDRLVNGKQFGDRRKLTWPQKMQEQKIEALDIYWFISSDSKHCPREVEKTLLQKHFNIYGKLPDWNKEI